MAWHPVIRHEGAGEKILFKVGLMTFKANSGETDGQFAFIETVLPPGSSVEPHRHPEAEVFYVLEGEFTFRVGEDQEAAICGKGSFVSVPPHMLHAYENHTDSPGKILGMLAPGGDGGLETFFRQVGVPVQDSGNIPDLSKAVSHLQDEIVRRKAGA